MIKLQQTLMRFLHDLRTIEMRREVDKLVLVCGTGSLFLSASTLALAQVKHTDEDAREHLGHKAQKCKRA